MPTADRTAHRTAHPLVTDDMAWIPTGDGKSFRPLRFDADGWGELMRIEPGATVGRHRHTGLVHAFNLAGHREIIDTGEVVGPGTYVFEPVGNIDSWRAVGDEACVVHILITGAVEYLDDDGRVTGRADSATQRAVYLDWCDANGVDPLDRFLPGITSIGSDPGAPSAPPSGSSARSTVRRY